MRIKLTPEQTDEVVVGELAEQIQRGLHEKDGSLYRSLHVVLAYYSIPGKFMEGAYDTVENDD
jgi:hypothetical protein